MVLYILCILAGALIIFLPCIVLPLTLLHPKYDKKEEEFALDKPLENPTPYISAAQSNGRLLRMQVSKATFFKVILFSAKGKPFKVYRVTCKDPTQPCWVKLPKKASGIAFVEPEAKKTVRFDMEIWKIFALPASFALSAAIGFPIGGYGLALLYFFCFAGGHDNSFYYPSSLTYLAIVIGAVAAYLIALACFLLRYMRFNKKEGK